jgi:transcriptional regulator with XRE-family HTH domain
VRRHRTRTGVDPELYPENCGRFVPSKLVDGYRLRWSDHGESPVPDDPNDLLRAAREAGELTQGQLAELANTQVERDTGKVGAMDADYIGKLERGVHRWPNQHYRRALRAVLRVSSDAALGLYSTRHRVATVRSSHRPANGGDDVERKAFLRVLAGSVAGLAFTDPLGDFVANAGSGARGRIGTTEIEQVRHMARMFNSQARMFGGGLSAQGVVAQLSGTADLLNGSFATQAVRQEMFLAISDLAYITAGTCIDAGSHQHAERCFRFAVGCATESGNWPMRARALTGMANLAVQQGRTEDALSFAEMALVRADRLTPMVRSVVHSRHARALAMPGRTREADCIAAVGRAEEQFAASSGDEPEWLAYYGQADLDGDCGRALLGLAFSGGDYSTAAQRLTSSITLFPNGSARVKARTMADLAALTMARDDPARAVQLGGEALACAETIRSDRVLEGLRQLRTASRKHRTMPAVRELNHRVDQALRATQV